MVDLKLKNLFKFYTESDDVEHKFEDIFKLAYQTEWTWFDGKIEILIGENIHPGKLDSIFAEIYSILISLDSIRTLGQFRVVFMRQPSEHILVTLCDRHFPEYENYWDLDCAMGNCRNGIPYRELINRATPTLGKTITEYLSTDLVVTSGELEVRWLRNSSFSPSKSFREILADDFNAFAVRPQGKKPYVAPYEFDWNDVPRKQLWDDAFGDAPDAAIGTQW